MLHGLFDGDRFLVWGDRWCPNRSLPLAELSDLPDYPFAIPPEELGTQLPPLGPAPQPTAVSLTLPSLAEEKGRAKQKTLVAIAAAAPGLAEATLLFPWRVAGLALDAAATLQFLGGLALGDSQLSGSLRFWSQVNRWVLSLVGRGRFYPTLVGDRARWRVLLESPTDRRLLEQFAARMPALCLATGPAVLACPWQGDRRQPLIAALDWLADARLRRSFPLDADALKPPLQDWVRHLGTDAEPVPEAVRERLQFALQRWLQPLPVAYEPWRTCFRLVPPAEGAANWQVDFGLQPEDDPEQFLSAAEIWAQAEAERLWQGRLVRQPQERLLAGLGQVLGLWPELAPVLEQPTPTSLPLTALQAYDFLRRLMPQLQEQGLGVLLPSGLRGDLASRLGLRVNASLPGRASLGLQSLLQFRWELSIGGQSLTQAQFEELASREVPLVEIGGEWVELRASDVRAARDFFAQRQKRTSLSLEDALRLVSGDMQTIGKLPVVQFDAAGLLTELVDTLSGKAQPEDLPTPEGLKATLRPYQSRGAGWLAFLQRWSLGACLADDMGLGKTIQFLAFLLHLKETDQREGPTLLICPTSVLGNWEREARRFAPDLKLHLHYGPDRLQGKPLGKAVQDCDLVLTSYALVHRDLKTLEMVDWQGVVLDEAQNIKNAEAKQSLAVRQLARRESELSNFRIALTGTPVENRLGELWAIMDFLNPDYLGNRSFFQKRYAVPIERFGDGASLQQLRSLVQPFLLRRLKTDRSIIADLPEKQEMNVFTGLTAEQAELYEKAVNAALSEIEIVGGIQRRGRILALLTRLKQICDHPELLAKASRVGEDFGDRSAKLQRLEEMLDELLEEGDRALIFTQFAEMGDLLRQRLQQRLGREVLLLTGATKRADREAMVQRFQEDPQAPPVFILSLKAGGVGLNLTRANHVFHFDRWWNPAVENQATDRAFRIGQRRNVQVHKFVCAGTLEERIDAIIASKQTLAEQVVGAGEDWLTDLDTSQLRDLLLLDRSAVLDT